MVKWESPITTCRRTQTIPISYKHTQLLTQRQISMHVYVTHTHLAHIFESSERLSHIWHICDGTMRMGFREPVASSVAPSSHALPL